MKVFISWSGPRSKLLAEALNGWLHNVVQSVQCFYSSEDIRAGQRWNLEINTRLAETDFGVLCVTPENIAASWLNFEAGALAKKLGDESRVVPVTLGFSPGALEDPLRQFNGVEANKDGILKLLRSIVEVAEATIDVETTFELWWPRLQEKIDAIPESVENVSLPEPPDSTDMMAEILGVVRGIASDMNRRNDAGLSGVGVAHFADDDSPKRYRDPAVERTALVDRIFAAIPGVESIAFGKRNGRGIQILEVRVGAEVARTAEFRNLLEYVQQRENISIKLLSSISADEDKS